MRLTLHGRDEIDKREGDKLRAYRDSQGNWTIGRGHTSAMGYMPVHPGMTISQAQSDALFERDIVTWEDMLDGALKVDVEPNQWDALLSVLHNVGPDFLHSTCIRELNAGNADAAAKAILMWNKPAELYGRRHSEYRQFLTPYVVAAHTPISEPVPQEMIKWETNGPIVMSPPKSPAPPAQPVIRGLPAQNTGAKSMNFWNVLSLLTPLIRSVVSTTEFQSAAVNTVRGIASSISDNAHNPAALKDIASTLANHAPGIVGAIVKGTPAEKLVDPAIIPDPAGSRG